MKVGTKYWRKATIAAVLAAMLLILSTAAVSAHNQNTGVFPISSHPYGKSYGEWSAKWWQYAFSVTSFDKCVSDRSGKVWFLAGTADGSIASRNCTVPEGKAILIPVFVVEWSDLEGACPLPDVKGNPIQGSDAKALRACAHAFAAHAYASDAKRKVQIDKTKLQDLKQYEAVSPYFSFTAVTGNLFSVPAGKGHSVADGFWIMLKPLCSGKHVVHFEATVPFPDLHFTFTTGATYNLTIRD